MKYTELKIFKLALDFATYNEEVVRRFEKYYKYTLGTDLRMVSKEILYSIHRINGAREANRKEALELLLDLCNQYQTLLLLCKQSKAFERFKHFEELSRLSYLVNSQALAWYNYTSARVSKSSSC